MGKIVAVDITGKQAVGGVQAELGYLTKPDLEKREGKGGAANQERQPGQEQVGIWLEDGGGVGWGGSGIPTPGREEFRWGWSEKGWGGGSCRY